MTTVRAAGPADFDALGDVLGRAFVDDPAWVWIYPQPDRARRLATMYRSLMPVTRSRGATVLTDTALRGAAVWQRSEQRRLGVLGNARMGVAMLTSGAKMRRAQAVLGAIERRHPKAPHWYLATLGTDPAHQGAGVGSALIHHVIDDPVNAHLPAYLETMTEANVSFYERHGFAVTGEIDVPDGGPHFWFMWRDPPSPAT